ncbi:MAG: hypothetical protein QOE95_2584 [Gaiellaceae bacterium]|jgi:hypothetical protein|nr:hypothetical protein [Gaiellaceae bacterium]
MAIEGLGPITGTFPKDRLGDDELQEIPAHVGFDEAWKDAIAQAEKAWHSPGQDRVEIPVTIEYEARIDIWNPGGIGQYNVKITPHG